MDLKEFISNSLTQIIEGICDAQNRNAESGAWISPKGTHMPKREGAQSIVFGDGSRYLDEIKFDVAISVTEGKKGEGGAALQIMSVSIGAKGNLSSEHAAVSRIQFSVPIVWPGSTNEEREQKIKVNTEQSMKKLDELQQGYIKPRRI